MSGSRLRRTIDKELNRTEKLSIEHTQFLTMNQLLEILPFKKMTIYEWIRRRKIPHYKVSNRVLFDKIEILEWLRKFYVEAG